MVFDFSYIFLNLLMLAIFVQAGQNVSLCKNYFGNALVCTLSFALVQGLRYMRGNDYMRYLHTYLHDDDPDQYLFTLLNQVLRHIGIGQHFFLIVYAAIFMACVMCFLKPYRRYAKYAFPLSIIVFLTFNEYVIRQALGFSFVLLSISEIIKLRELQRQNTYAKRIYSIIFHIIIFSCLAFSIHSVSIVIIVGVFAISFIPIAIPWYAASIGYGCVIFFIANLFDWNTLGPLLEVIANRGDQLTSKYASNADVWFSGDTNEEWGRHPIIKLLDIVGHCSLFFLMFKIIKRENRKVSFLVFYNIFVIGSCFFQLFFLNEILRRVAEPFHFFWWICLSIVLCNYKNMKIRFKPLIYLSLTFWIWDYIRYLFLRGGNTMFIWDM